MTRNQKNVLKFAIATIAAVVALDCVSQEHMTTYHIIGLVVSIIVFLWYCYHVFTDN